MAGGGIIRWKNASFSLAREVRPPVEEGLEGWFYPRENADRAIINYAKGGADAYLVGAPVINQGYAEFTGKLDYMQTPIFERSTFTWYVVARNKDTLATVPTSPLLIGNPNGDSGSYLYMDSNASGLPVGDLRAISYSNSAPVILANNGVPNVNNWRMYCLIATTTTLTAYDLTGGTNASGTFTGTRLPNSRLIRLGSVYDPSSLAGKCDIAFAAMYADAHNSSQRTAIMNFVNYDLSFEGVVVSG